MNEALEECTKRIKVSNVEIVVHGSSEKPYYEIKYRDLSDGKVHVGYSSYNLDFVFEWLEKCFEVLEARQGDTIVAPIDTDEFGHVVKEMYLSPTGIIFSRYTKPEGLYVEEQKAAEEYIGKNHPEIYMSLFGEVKEA